LAITASHSPLARKADLALIVDHVEDVATQVPMVSRILHLLIIDILAVGVAMSQGRQGEQGSTGTTDLPSLLPLGLDAPAPAAPAAPAVAHRAGPGISTAGPLARLTSHSR
jgi:glucokinase